MSDFTNELQDHIKYANKCLASDKELSEEQVYTILLASLLEEEANE